MANQLIKISFLFLLACLFGCATSFNQKEQPIYTTHFADSGEVSVLKSINDPRHYRYIQLNNGIKVLLISDEKADVAAAALNVNVGSRHDPSDRLGLAHFLEHMLFLGTEKYPEPDDYQKYIASHGGNHNAFTSFENTVYFFDIDHQYLEPALDRFSQFFISPLFNEEYVKREMQAVESEFRARYNNEYRRVIDAVREIINPNHPYARFSVGNLQTLNHPDIRNRLIHFYKEHYSASRMTLSISGNHSLDVLEEMTREKFSSISTNNKVIDRVDEKVFNRLVNEESNKVIAAETRKPMRRMHLAFPIKDYYKNYSSKSYTYLAQMINDKGEDSLFSVLKTRNLLEGLSASLGVRYNGGAIFQVSLTLTEEGFTNLDTIVNSLFYHVNKIEQEAINEPHKVVQRFEGYRQLSETAFRFYSSSRVVYQVMQATSNLQHFSPEHVLFADYNFENISLPLITSATKEISPNNMAVVINSENLPDWANINKTSPFYQTEYGLVDIPKEWLESWQAIRFNEKSDALPKYAFLGEIKLPDENEFIAKDFDLIVDAGDFNNKKLSSEALEKIASEKGFEIWFKLDTTFDSPEADMKVAFIKPEEINSAKDYLSRIFYATLVEEQLTEILYPAYNAGLSAAFYPHIRGFTLAISGYNEKLNSLFYEYIEHLDNVVIEQEHFERIKKMLSQSFLGQVLGAPGNILAESIGYEIFDGNYPPEVLLDELQRLQVEDIEQFSSRFAEDSFLQILIHGNMGSDEVEGIYNAVNEIRHCECELSSRGDYNVNLLEPGLLHKTKKLEHQDSAINWFFQAEDETFYSTAATLLTSKILSPAYFNQLRTEKQLGYLVAVYSEMHHKRSGISFLVQSPSASEEKLYRETKAFIDSCQEFFDEETFKSHKAAFIQKLSQPDINLNARSERYWQELALGIETFNYKDEIITQLNQLDYSDWKEFINRLFFNASRSLLLTTEKKSFDIEPNN